jgi:hypothetical protein
LQLKVESWGVGGLLTAKLQLLFTLPSGLAAIACNLSQLLCANFNFSNLKFPECHFSGVCELKNATRSNPDACRGLKLQT